MRKLSIAVLGLGVLLHFGILVSTSSGHFDWFVLLLLFWLLIPYLLAGWAAWKSSQVFACLLISFAVCVLVALSGPGLSYKIMYLDEPDAQAGIGLLFVPFFQMLVLIPLAVSSIFTNALGLK